MEDLNDYYYFAAVVSNGGFASAGRALNTPRSKLSRRIAQLEARLGARLIERSTHRFRVTELGEAFYERCRNMLTEAERAKSIIVEAQSEPQGIVRMSCPNGLADITVAEMLPAFLERYPKVKLQMIASDKRVDLIDERIDVAIRARTQPDTETGLTTRSLARARRILVASPALAKEIGDITDVHELDHFPTVSMTEWNDHDTWEFIDPDGEKKVLEHQPRFTTRSMPALMEAVRAGVGVGLILKQVCAQDVRSGKLVQLLPDWQTTEGRVYLVFTTARGMPPAVRALIDFLVEGFRGSAEVVSKIDAQARGLIDAEA